MGVEPTQAELNAALNPIFSDISNVYLIHDDLIIATKNTEKSLEANREVMKVITRKNLTLNSSKCTLGAKEINFFVCVKFIFF